MQMNHNNSDKPSKQHELIAALRRFDTVIAIIEKNLPLTKEERQSFARLLREALETVAKEIQRP
jgi:hypothetical protein